MNINGINVTEEDYIELAKWANHLERELNKLVEESRELKSNLLAVVHQRNSLHKKLEMMKQDSVFQNISVVESIIVTNEDLINPEQYQIAEYKPKIKSKLDIN
jgi:hypothetical protein